MPRGILALYWFSVVSLSQLFRPGRATRLDFEPFSDCQITREPVFWWKWNLSSFCVPPANLTVTVTGARSTTAMPLRSPDQRRQGLGDDGVWRLMAALLRAWDIGTHPEKQASVLWFSAVGDITTRLLAELESAASCGSAANGRIQDLEAVPAQPHGLGGAIDGAVTKLEELTFQRDVTPWVTTKRSAGDAQGSRASAAAYAEALMVMADTVRILSRCMELHPTSPSSHLKAEMCEAVQRVVDRCAIAVEFRCSIRALQSAAFEIKMGTSTTAAAGGSSRICVRLDAGWAASPQGNWGRWFFFF